MSLLIFFFLQKGVGDGDIVEDVFQRDDVTTTVEKKSFGTFALPLEDKPRGRRRYALR